jgi:hypothetical protein
MSLDIQLFKKGFDIHKSRADIDAAYTKLQAIKEALEQLEAEYEGFTVDSISRKGNKRTYCQSG